jgi:hypothetical protein
MAFEVSRHGENVFYVVPNAIISTITVAIQKE